jgi:hypothetical protein
MNAIMFLTHPQQFDTLVRVKDQLVTNLVAQHWASVATGLCWMVNHTSPKQCDKSGFRKSFDYFSVFGPAHTKLILKDLGLTFKYCASCVTAIAGRTFTHEVPAWGSHPSALASQDGFVLRSSRSVLSQISLGQLKRLCGLSSV